jgi:hypothetical protein
MKDIKDSAFVVSVHYEKENAARINLRWKGRHDISQFDFDHLGEVVDSNTETENTGWVVVRHSLHSLPSSTPFGPAITGASDLVMPGDAIPLRRVHTHKWHRICEQMKAEASLTGPNGVNLASMLSRDVE